MWFFIFSAGELVPYLEILIFPIDLEYLNRNKYNHNHFTDILYYIFIELTGGQSNFKFTYNYYNLYTYLLGILVEGPL